jgi:hypothetical protein
MANAIERKMIDSRAITHSGSREIRIAELDGKYWVYFFDWNTGQVTGWGNEFAKHTDDGIRYVADPFKTLRAARKKFNDHLKKINLR